MTDNKEFAKQMRENAVKNESGNIICSPELWEEIASIIERAIIPPCKVGDTVYVITDCSHIMMYYDNDYLTGTGAIECPFEDVCNFTDCNDENTQVLETYVNFMGCEDGSEWFFRCEHINGVKDFNEIGKTVFLTKEEAEQALAERSAESG